jgi:hypothetical protein
VYQLEFAIPGNSSVPSRPITLEYTAGALEITQWPDGSNAVVGVPYHVYVQASLNGDPVPNVFVRAHCKGLHTATTTELTGADGIARFSLLFSGAENYDQRVIHFRVCSVSGCVDTLSNSVQSRTNLAHSGTLG